MGLDMYLNGNNGNEVYWRKANHIHRWFVDNCQDGIDECQLSEVTRKDLNELLNKCNDILNKANKMLPKGWATTEDFWSNEAQKINPGWEVPQMLKDYAKSILPATAGFFFGGTGYDLWYFRDVASTADNLISFLSKEEEDSSFTYQSSW